jgi:rRNA small subunit pseudouridine methyltransferase Nep1
LQGPVSLLLADAAVELVPREISRHPSVEGYARRRGKRPENILLDSSYHYPAMRGLAAAEKRGRPDILHTTLLEALGSPLNKAGVLRVFCHTQSGLIIEVNPSVRLPRNYDRFKGLLEKLLVEGFISTERGETLLRAEKRGLREWIRENYGDGAGVILLSETGQPASERMLVEQASTGRAIFAVGCFPRGDFSEEVKSIAQGEISISCYRLEAWVAASRLLCLLERGFAALEGGGLAPDIT